MNTNELDQIEADVNRVLKTAKEKKWGDDTFNHALANSILKAVAELRAVPALLAAAETARRYIGELMVAESNYLPAVDILHQLDAAIAAALEARGE